jgi:hypothetical protein
MRRFLYFIPNAKPEDVKKAALIAVGLLDRFAGGADPLLSFVRVLVDVGPGGTPGTILAAGHEMCGYCPDDQQWADAGKFWLAIDGPLSPGPAHLARTVAIAGDHVTLQDRQQWLVPLIRRWDESRTDFVSNLPTTMARVAENGAYRFVPQVHPAYRSIDAIAGRTLDAYASKKVLTAEDLFNDATELLSLNYRIGVDEACLLGLMDLDLAATVLRVSVDIPRFEAFEAAAEVNGLIVDPVDTTE